MIRITVVTITYNAEAVLQRTLQSVLRQTYKGVEHLIIDGASKDGTLKMAEDYKNESDQSDRGHKVIIKSEPDRGIYDAMNKGLMQASGDYIVFMNAGDCFPKDDTLEQVVRRCRLSECPSDELPGVLYGLTDIVDDEGRYLRPRRLQPPSQLNWRSFRHGMLVCHQAFIARRDLAPQYDLRYRYSADFDWCIRVLQVSPVNAYVGDQPIISYLNDGLTTSNHRASLRERYDIMCHYYGTLPTMLRHVGFAGRHLWRKITS